MSEHVHQNELSTLVASLGVISLIWWHF